MPITFQFSGTDIDPISARYRLPITLQFSRTDIDPVSARYRLPSSTTLIGRRAGLYRLDLGRSPSAGREVIGDVVIREEKITPKILKQQVRVNSVIQTKEIDTSKVIAEFRAPLIQVIQKYLEIFSKQGYDIGKTDIIQHHIDTQGHAPIRLKPYRTPYKLQYEMQKHIKEMLANDIIKPSLSPWAAPALLVRKHYNSTRFVVDYRALNACTKFDSYPMPRIDYILDKLNNKSYFTCLDLASGYHNVCVDPSSQEKTAFIVENGLFEYKRLPFGLVSAPAYFSRLMDQVLRDVLGKFALAYLDDIIIFSETAEEHLIHIEKIFLLLKEAKLKLKGKNANSSLNK